MANLYKRKYGVAATLDFELYATDGTELKVDAVHASGDTTISKDEGDFASTTNGFVDEGVTYSITLTSTEMQAARIVVAVVDQGTKAWLDKVLIIETYGNASAQHEFDSDSATVNLSSTTETQIDAIEADTNEVQGKLPTNKIMGSSVVTDKDDEIDAIKAKTDLIGASVALETGGNIAAIKTVTDTLSLAAINAEVDTALADIDLDHVAKTTYGASKPAVGSLMDKVLNKSGDQTFDPTTDSLEAIRDNQAGADAAAIADAVWDEAIAGHTGAGTFGAKNQKVVPSETLSDYKADVSSLALEAGGNLAAVKAKTDLIGASVALESGGNLAAVLADTNELQTDWANGGRLDLLLDATKEAVDTEVAAIKAVTDTLSLAAIADAVWDEANSGHVAAGSVGLALSNLLKIGKNKWGYSGTTFTIYDDDDVTPLYTFTLDSATAPTTRTPT